jgi:glycosyltransferase involved in cell wall biosynthesis
MGDSSGGPLRILEIETFGRGGLTHYACNLSCALAGRGHEVTLMTSAGFELEGLAELLNEVRVVKALARVTQGRRLRVPGALQSASRKVEAVADAVRAGLLARRMEPDVIHLHCTNPIALVYLETLKRLRRPLVMTAHVVTPHERVPLQNVVYRRINRLGDLVIAHSSSDRDRLLKEFTVEPERVVVIPHGEYGFFDRGRASADSAAARSGLGLDRDDEVVLFFGYIREYKGLDLLLEAWPAVREARPAARLLIAGDPVRLAAQRRDDLAAWATRLGAVSRFEYIPFDDVSRYFGAADVLVMPYRHISQSGVLYLALSLGVPVVATEVGALPEVLDDGVSALLVPPESPDALAAALIRVLGDRGLRERLARGGERVAEEHSWPAIARRTERELAGLVRRHRSSGRNVG